MSTKDTSQAQQKSGAAKTATEAFDPVIPMVLSMDAWGRLAQDSMQRIQSLYDELAGFESSAYERARNAGTQWADLMTETVDYFTKLTAEWRNATLEATRRSAELFGGKA